MIDVSDLTSNFVWNDIGRSKLCLDFFQKGHSQRWGYERRSTIISQSAVIVRQKNKW